MGVNNGRTRRTVMPKVGGKSYAYTGEGRRKAAAARARMAAANKKKKKKR